MVVYLDVLFLVNSTVNLLLLLACCRFAGREVPLWRMILAGSLGGAYAVLAALPALQVLSGWTGKAVSAFLMLLTAYGWGRQLMRMAVWLALLSAAFAGVVLMLSSVFGVGVYMIGGTAVYPISFGTLVLLAGVSYCVIALALQQFGKYSAAEDLKPVTICCAGKRHRFTALMDNGNVLRDPVTGQQVFVLDGRFAASLLPQLSLPALQQPAEAFTHLAKLVPGLRLVPYRAVGVSSGLLLAVKSDWIILGKKKLPGATVAFSPSPVSGGAYQVIAGGS